MSTSTASAVREQGLFKADDTFQNSTIVGKCEVYPPQVVFKSMYEIDKALRTIGYFAGFPFSMGADARKAEFEEAAANSCSVCGCPGLSLSPYYRGDQCESVCYCCDCGHACILEPRRAS